MTTGRFAGKKAVVTRNYDDGNKVLLTSFQKHKFPHLLVVGIARNPQRVHRKINKKKFIKKTGVKTFLKAVNQNHVMPTRFLVNDFDFKEVKEDNLKGENRVALKKKFRKAFSEVYRNLPNPKTN